jgi:hypothetical protein
MLKLCDPFLDASLSKKGKIEASCVLQTDILISGAKFSSLFHCRDDRYSSILAFNSTSGKSISDVRSDCLNGSVCIHVPNKNDHTCKITPI